MKLAERISARGDVAAFLDRVEVEAIRRAGLVVGDQWAVDGDDVGEYEAAITGLSGSLLAVAGQASGA